MTEASADFSLQELQCPRCGAPSMDVVKGRRLHCPRCGADYVVAETVCPACSQINTPGTVACTRCGSPISRACPTCGTRNWAIAESCEHCGEALDAVAEMSTRWSHRTQARLTELMNSAVDIKRREAAAANARSAALWEIERHRQDKVQIDMARRRTQERLLLLVVVAAILIMLILVLIMVAPQMAR
jgi:ribosomal protein S27AE